MKRTSLIGVALTLLMLLLVAGGGLVFTFQSQRTLERRLQQEKATADVVAASGTRTAVSLAQTEATRETIAAARATAEAETVLLEEQLVASQQEVDRLDEQLGQTETALAAAESELAQVRDEFLAQPPGVAIIRPAQGARFPADTAVPVVIAAAAPTGVDRVEVTLEETSVFTGGGRSLFTQYLTRTLTTPGRYTVTVTAYNTQQEIGAANTSFEILPTVTTVRAEVASALLALRADPPLVPSAPLVIPRAEMEQWLTLTFPPRPLTADSVRDAVRVWSLFDFVERDADLFTPLQTLQAEPFAALIYDLATETFYRLPATPPSHPQSRWLAMYELTRRQIVTDTADLPFDARLAQTALAAGEARLAQGLYLDGDFLTVTETAVIQDRLTLTPTTLLDFLPPALTAQLLFPHTTGFAWVGDRYTAGGYAAIDALWAQPPLSSEQILHPDRYPGQEPETVTIPSLGDTLGAAWTPLAEGTLGEFRLRRYLAQGLAPAEVEAATAGWGGDRFAAYHRGDDEALALAWRLVWDTPQDQAAFQTRYPAYPAAQYGTSGRPQQASGGTCWQGADVLCFYPRPADSLIVRAPDLETAVALAEAIP